MDKDNQNNQRLGRTGKEKIAWLPIKAGCLTVTIASIAIGIGLWIDISHNTVPRWTLIILIGSAPIALGLVFYNIRQTLARARGQTKMKDE